MRTPVRQRLKLRGPRALRKAKKARGAKKAGRCKKVASKPKADSTNKRVEVIAMMKHTQGVGRDHEGDWLAAAYPVRGFVSILGSKGRGEDRVVPERRG